jgi:hypothetical protein
MLGGPDLTTFANSHFRVAATNLLRYYFYIRVLVLLHICPHTSTHVFLYSRAGGCHEPPPQLGFDPRRYYCRPAQVASNLDSPVLYMYVCMYVCMCIYYEI